MSRAVGTARGPAPGAAAAEATEPLPAFQGPCGHLATHPFPLPLPALLGGTSTHCGPISGLPPADVILPGHTWGRDDLTVLLPSDLPLLQSFLTHSCPRRHTAQQTPCTRRGRQTWLTTPSLPLPSAPMESTQELGSWH